VLIQFSSIASTKNTNENSDSHRKSRETQVSRASTMGMSSNKIGGEAEAMLHSVSSSIIVAIAGNGYQTGNGSGEYGHTGLAMHVVRHSCKSHAYLICLSTCEKFHVPVAGF
jgi:hypothetical protein